MGAGMPAVGDGNAIHSDRLLVPDSLARAAATYQGCRIQLEALRQQRLASLRAGLRPAGPSRGATTLGLIHDARMARDVFRGEVRHVVDYLRSTGAPLPRMLDYIRSMLA